MRSFAILVLVAIAARVNPASAAPPSWTALRVDQSWRDTPARMIIEDVSRQAGVRPLLDDAVAIRLDAAHITLLARNQPVSVLLKRIGELTDTDIVIVGERLVVYDHGRVPALLIVANELNNAGTVVAASEASEEIRRDCEWIDLTAAAVTAEMSKAFDVPVILADAMQGRQELVAYTAKQATLEQAVTEVCRQLDCPYGWMEGVVVIGQNGPGVPKHTGPAVRRRTAKVAAPLRLSGEVLTWQELAHLTETGCGQDVILPEAQRGRSLGKMWANGDALDVVVARAMWSPGRLSVETTAGSLALHGADDEGTTDTE